MKLFAGFEEEYKSGTMKYGRNFRHLLKSKAYRTTPFSSMKQPGELFAVLELPSAVKHLHELACSRDHEEMVGVHERYHGNKCG